MAFPKAKSIWVDGKFVPWDDANVHVTTHAMHYGSSVFEGMRAYKTDRGPAILGLDLHVDRLLASCKMYRLPLPFSRDEIRQACIDVVKANAHESCYIRPLAFRGAENFSLDPRRCPPHLIILTLEWGRYLGPEALEKGVDVGVSSWRRMAPRPSANGRPVISNARGTPPNPCWCRPSMGLTTLVRGRMKPEIQWRTSISIA